MRSRHSVRVELRDRAYRIYNDRLQRKLATTVWAVSNNYFKSASGRIVTQWPYGRIFYSALLRTLGPLGVRLLSRRDIERRRSKR
jgi:hypothetical protein